jgi:hypothetical protein
VASPFCFRLRRELMAAEIGGNEVAGGVESVEIGGAAGGDAGECGEMEHRGGIVGGEAGGGGEIGASEGLKVGNGAV